MFKQYKHILWDWNGTLLDDSWLCVEVLNGLLKESDKPTITYETYKEHFNFPVIHFYEFLGFETSAASFDQLSKSFISEYEKRWLKECQLHIDAERVLKGLQEKGISHSILSAAHENALTVGTQHFGINRHFAALLGTDNIYAEGKIARANGWLAESSWDAEDILLIGDTLHDYEVAKAIGVECILIASGHCARSRLEETNARVLNSLGECLPLL
jgi:phosphoglycolate phosphatase